MTRVSTPGRDGARPSRTWRVIGGCALLGLPTVIWPGSEGAAIAYLIGLSAIVAALAIAASRWRGPARLGWCLVAAAAACWLLGDLVQRLLVVFGGDEDAPGAPDVLWLSSYPLMVAGVGAMIHGRHLAADIRREVTLDVLVVTVAGALGAWKLMIAPGLDTGTLTLDVVLTVLYPLGDVALFATALTLLIAPGRPSTSGRLLVLCLGATLVIDALFTALPTLAPSFDVDRFDGVLLLVNGLLPAAALHESGARLAEAPRGDDAGAHMHRWRVVLLGGGLVTVSVAAVLPAANATSVDTAILLTAAAATSVTVVARFYGVVRKREAAEQRLAHQAHHDHLTGLANRALLLQRLADQLHRGRREGDDEAPDPLLMYLDLDGFKSINDRHGHAAGDHVLHTIGARLSELTRLGDTVARLGGDEFVVLCTGVPADSAGQLGQKLCRAVVEPIALPSGDVVTVGASVGITPVSGLPTGPTAGDGVGDAEEVLRAADAAMYEAKHGGGGVRLA